jgi:protein-tyrosine phosphatase
MAESVLRSRLDRSEFVIESAGLNALAGRPIDPLAEATLAEHGLTGGAHVARQVTPQMVERAELVLVMEEPHVALVRSLSPQATGRIFLLGHWHERVGIPDPYRQPRYVFRDVYWMIDKAVGSWCRQLGETATS